MTNSPDTYAVFGHPVGHSKSPYIHGRFAEQTRQNLIYSARDVPPENFRDNAESFFAAGGKGLNCTVPLKELAWRYAERLTPRARLAGAVNTLAIQADGGILGDNTDGIGLVTDLTDNQQIRLPGSRILILGAGGAARGILGPLLDSRPQQIVIANRSLDKAAAIAADFAKTGEVASIAYPALAGRQFDLIINATSASLSGQLPPLPDKLLAAQGCCYDLAYASQPTAFVEWGRKHLAAKSLDGLGMLVEQAAEAFLLWRGVRPQTAGLIGELNRARQ
ncbi:MAG: shikimate dehydrogenase [Methylococcales bacterium]|nr:shikimate dehydrogenase [Methylococcales bacterium]